MPAIFLARPTQPFFLPQANFHAFFQHIASQDKRKDRASGEEIKNYIFEDILGRGPAMNSSISFNDFGEIRKAAGMPFAKSNLGYWWKNKYTRPSLTSHLDQCGSTFKSDSADANQYIKNFLAAVQPYSNEDVFKNGVSEQSLQTYYNDPKNNLLQGPIKTMYGPWPSYTGWSQPYDVGAAKELFWRLNAAGEDCKDFWRSDAR
jgi:hypothetical protein